MDNDCHKYLDRLENIKNLDDTQFVYRRKCFVPWSPFETEVTNATKCTDAAHRLQYAEILFRYLSDSYRATLGQSIELAALALISDLGNNRHVAVNHYDEEEEEDEEYRESMEFLILHLKSYMPQRILNLYNDLQLKRLLNRILDEQAHKINVNDEKQMEAYINNVNIANISDVEESIEDEKKGLATQKQIRIQSKSTRTIQSTSSSDEDNNDNSSSEDDTFIVHSTEEALKRIHENGIQKKKKNESEDLFSALFAWCATERDEDM